MVSQTALGRLPRDAVELLVAYGIGGLAARSRSVVSIPTNLQIDPAAICLVTGPSGSGKSSSIPCLIAAMRSPALADPPSPDPDRPVIAQWADLSATEAARRLGPVGLADPITWAQHPTELSVGQHHRLALALAIYGPPGVLVLDEWLAPLDRLTARAVAWATTRALRRAGRGAILVTAHDDLLIDTAPDLHIRVNWQPEPEIEPIAAHHGCCSIIDELAYSLGTTADWQALASLHYAAGDPATYHSIHVARHPLITGPAAVAVLSWPDMHSAARNLATDDTYRVVGRPGELQRLNREVVKLSRLVVTPELRGVGVAGWLIHRIIEQTSARWVECVTAMGRHSGFLARIGMREIPQTPTAAEARLMDLAAALDMPPEAALDPGRLWGWATSLSVRQARSIRQAVWHVYHVCKLWRRTHRNAPKVIPGPNDPRWADAWDLASRRLTERPSYWVYGPIDRMTGMPDDPSDQRLTAV
jgi:ABC-type lipoprotein export system ATPase subunit